jgi:hypothetical protein
VYGLVLQHTLFSVGEFWLNRKSRKNNTENSVKLIFTNFRKSSNQRRLICIRHFTENGVPVHSMRYTVRII